MFFVGSVLYIIGRFNFYPMWSLGQIPGVVPFLFTHLGWPANNFYAEWMPSIVLSGSALWWGSALILFIGGVHIPGMMFFLGTTGLTIAAILDLYAGTAASRFAMSMIVQSEWWFLSSFGVIFLGFIFSIWTGLRPLPDGVFGCNAQWCRASQNIKGAKPQKAERTGGFGRPCACGDGCAKSCKTTWIGDNKGLFGIWAICFLLGIATFLLGIVFYSQYSVRQFDPTNNDFSFAHQSYPSNGYLVNPFVVYMLIIGSGLLFVNALILMIGGLHLPGIFWVAGTGAFVSAYSMWFVYGTSGTGNVTNLEIALWVILAGWISVIIGCVCCIFTGLTPRGMSSSPFSDAKKRIKESQPKPSEEISDDESEDDDEM
jgi:hypothetical protein